MIATRTLSCWRRGPPLPDPSWPLWPLLLVNCLPSSIWRGGIPASARNTPRANALLQGVPADQLRAHVPDALADGDDREDGQHVDRDLEHVVDVAEHQAGGEDHDA